MPDFAVPLATFKGYSLRRSGFAAGEQKSLSSSQLVTALTNAAPTMLPTTRTAR